MYNLRPLNSKPRLGFELNVLYKLLEAKGIYVAGHEYENVYQLSRIDEALFLLKAFGGAYTITLDSKLYEQVSNKTGVKLKLSVPVTTPVGSTNASGLFDSVISSVNNEFVTKFCDKPEYERIYNSEGKSDFINMVFKLNQFNVQSKLLNKVKSHLQMSLL